MRAYRKKGRGKHLHRFRVQVKKLNAFISLAGMVPHAPALGRSFKTGIEKARYRIPAGKLVWKVDEFLGPNEDLVVAEIELEYEDQAFEKPPWLCQEVTTDERYANSRLAKCPYTEWLEK